MKTFKLVGYTRKNYIEIFLCLKNFFTFFFNFKVFRVPAAKRYIRKLNLY